MNACLRPFFGLNLFASQPCEPQCHRTREPVVTQAGPSEFYVITDDAYTLQINCPGQQVVALPDVTIGSDLIHLPCPCSITYGSTTLVAARLVCDNHSITEVAARRVVPIQWTRRAAPSFLDLISGTTLLNRHEITLDQENEVPISDEPTLQPWMLELISALGGAALVALASAVTKFCRSKFKAKYVKQGDEISLKEVGQDDRPPVPPRGAKPLIVKK
ncbi:hypothetical protein ONE63_011412 [Megalurothrips usitatus]|uniref:Uncharacterized protein n=1 Tax=Megalurothrips usitatus TaxID=439358 RepID=A0AAV7X2G2_9NEOP|nr:hypothetical protein ONE63_011412 [Megalurothrips usitatus]